MSATAIARWRGLDALRGLAVVGMLLVNNPGDHDAVYAQLRHSEWNGCTIADLVFPLFLFVVGITTTISLSSRPRRGDDAASARIGRRAAAIFGIGLLLNWFPFYQSGDLAWTIHPGLIDRIVARLLILRIPGVMQRIAIAYLAAALVARRASSRAILIVTASLLVGYWLLLTSVQVPGEGAIGALLLDDPPRTIVAHVDRMLFDWSRWRLGNHLWESSVTWDPEGALSTLPAIATVLLGVVCGRWMLERERRRRIERLLIVGALTTLAGWYWGFLFPVNKSLWTSSFVLFTGGVAMLLLVGATITVDTLRTAAWAIPLVIFGENPLIAYVGSEVARRTLHSSIKIPTLGHRLGLDEWATQQFERAGLSLKAASLAWAVLFLAAWLAALSRLSRRRYFVRV